MTTVFSRACVTRADWLAAGVIAPAVEDKITEFHNFANQPVLEMDTVTRSIVERDILREYLVRIGYLRGPVFYPGEPGFLQ